MFLLGFDTHPDRWRWTRSLAGVSARFPAPALRRQAPLRGGSSAAAPRGACGGRVFSPTRFWHQRPLAVICVILGVISRYLFGSNCSGFGCRERSQARSLWDLGVLCHVSEHLPPFGAGRYRTQAHLGAPWPSPGVNHFSREPGFFRMVLGTEIWALSVSSMEPCGSWPVCADFCPAAALSQRVQESVGLLGLRLSGGSWSGLWVWLMSPRLGGS